MQFIKDFIQRLLWTVNKAIITRPAILSRNPGSVLEISLSLLLSELYLSRERLTVVQVGAFDGITGDPLHDFITKHPVHGVLVEPQPALFRRLQSTYGNCAHLSLVNAAVAEEDGVGVMYSVRQDAIGPDWMHQLASFDKETVLKHKQYLPELESFIETIRVPCLSPQSLLQAQRIENVDVLVVDTEGYDAKIIRGFRKAQIRPAVIHFEHAHLDPKEYEACLAELIKDGYRIAVSGTDTLAYSQGESGRIPVAGHQP
jgi:FkbM family methyltransferase